MYDSNLVAIDTQQKKFRQLLEKLSKKAVLVSPKEAIEKRFQTTRPLVCFTFDDGFEDNLTVVAPVLEEFGLKGIFFVNPAFVGLTDSNAATVLRSRYNSEVKKCFLDRAQVKNLSDRGHLVGSHGLTHERLNTEDVIILRNELEESKRQIEEITQVSCELFAYPFGGHHDISRVGLEMALTVYSHTFSGIRSSKLFEFNKRVINRRHFEGNWPCEHINYFLARRCL